jgi:type IV conjugative transfer system protein TraL
MSDQRYYIPRYIDEPYRIIIFTIDELVLITLIMIFAFAVGHELIGIVAASTI